MPRLLTILINLFSVMAMSPSEVRPFTMTTEIIPSTYSYIHATSFQTYQSGGPDGPYGDTSRLTTGEHGDLSYAITAETLESHAANDVLANGTARVECPQTNADIEEVGTSDEDDYMNFVEQDYNMTAHQDETLDNLVAATCQATEDISGIEDYSYVEKSYPYKNLISCNGDFALPLALADVAQDMDSRSTTATICDEDHCDLQDTLRESSWT